MTHIPAVGQDRAINSSASYNAVKIQINNPKTNIPEDFCPKCENNNDYNSVNIEVNEPSVEAQKKPVYDYPESKELVTYDQAFVKPKKLPPLPLAYQIINNRTFVNAEFGPEKVEEIPETEEVVVPEANFTTVEDEKAAPESALSFRGEEPEETPVKEEVSFRGEEEVEEAPESEVSFRGEEEVEEAPESEVSFRGEEEIEEAPENEVSFRGEAEVEEAPESEVSFRGEAEETEAPNSVNFKAAQQIEIVPPEEIKPDVDINDVVEKLNGEDYDVQAKQIYDMVLEIKESPEKAENYIVTDIFSSLTNIIQKDVSELEQPDENKNDLRKKYIVNEIVKEQARLNGEDPEKVELPYELKDEEVADAVKLTDFEMAERNKDYALTALAILAKNYADGVEKQSGNTVPLTDLPGVSACVDTLRNGSNPDLKVKAIEVLMYINRPEYKEELKSIFELSSKDENPAVAMISTAAVQYLNENAEA